MRETDPLLSVHMTQELARSGGSLTEDTARWSGLVDFRGYQYIADLSSFFGRLDTRLSSTTIRLALKPVTGFGKSGKGMILDIMEHPNKAVHVARDSNNGNPAAYHPVHWHFTRTMTEPEPLTVKDIDRIHHAASDPLHDKEEFEMFWELSQTLYQAK